MEPSGVSPGPRYDPALFWNGVAWRLRLRGFDPDLTGPAGSSGSSLRESRNRDRITASRTAPAR
jgi:hypothetical protein